MTEGWRDREAEIGLLSPPGRATLDLLSRVESLCNNPCQVENGAAYPDGDFGNGLREIAGLVKTRVCLEAACIDLGGWDAHFIPRRNQGIASRTD